MPKGFDLALPNDPKHRARIVDGGFVDRSNTKSFDASKRISELETQLAAAVQRAETAEWDANQAKIHLAEYGVMKRADLARAEAEREAAERRAKIAEEERDEAHKQRDESDRIKQRVIVQARAALDDLDAAERRAEAAEAERDYERKHLDDCSARYRDLVQRSSEWLAQAERRAEDGKREIEQLHLEMSVVAAAANDRLEFADNERDQAERRAEALGVENARLRALLGNLRSRPCRITEGEGGRQYCKEHARDTKYEPCPYSLIGPLLASTAPAGAEGE